MSDTPASSPAAARPEPMTDLDAISEFVDAHCTGHPDCAAPHAALKRLRASLSEREAGGTTTEGDPFDRCVCHLVGPADCLKHGAQHARDARLGAALREVIATGDAQGGRLLIEWGGDGPPGVGRENWATLRDDNDACYTLAALLRDPAPPQEAEP